MERRDHVVRLGGLRQVVDRAQLDRLDGRRDAAVPVSITARIAGSSARSSASTLRPDRSGSRRSTTAYAGTAVARVAQRGRAVVRDRDVEAATREAAREARCTRLRRSRPRVRSAIAARGPSHSPSMADRRLPPPRRRVRAMHAVEPLPREGVRTCRHCKRMMTRHGAVRVEQDQNCPIAPRGSHFCSPFAHGARTSTRTPIGRSRARCSLRGRRWPACSRRVPFRSAVPTKAARAPRRSPARGARGPPAAPLHAVEPLRRRPAGTAPETKRAGTRPAPCADEGSRVTARAPT